MRSLTGVWRWCCLMVAVIGVWSAGAAIERRIEGHVRQTSVVAVDLDEGVYRQTQLDWGDLRVVDSEGREVARVVEPKRKYKFEKRTIKHSARLEQLSELPDGGLALDFRVPGTNKVEFSKLVVVTGLKDFEQSVRVQISDGKGGWQEVVEAEPLYDYSRYADVRKCSVELPQLRERSYRLVVEKADDQVFSRYVSMTESRGRWGKVGGGFKRYSVEQRPFRIDAIEMHEVKESAVPVSIESVLVPVAEFEVEHSRDKRVTSIVVDGGLSPLKSLMLNPAEMNFERQVKVEELTAGGWKQRGKGGVVRTRLPDMEAVERCEIELGDLRAGKIKVEIANHDNPPLTLLPGAVSCRRLRYQVLFIAEPGSSYRLVYGNPLHREPPVYEQGVMNYLRSGRDAELWQLGAESGHQSNRLRAALINYWRRHGMMSVSLAVMAVLGLLLWRAVRLTRS